MPPKVRELIAELVRNGFYNRGGKGSHRNFIHRTGINATVSGKPGDDADRYQIKQVREAIEASKKS